MKPLLRWRNVGLLTILASLAVGTMVWWQVRSPQATKATHQSLSKLPRLMLWAWERPEALDFPSDEDFGVAYIAYQIWLDGDGVRSLPRRQPLRVGGRLAIPVVHVEANAFNQPHLNASQSAEIVALAVAAGRASKTAIVQIDFEARPSQRDFYARVLRDVRRQLPQHVGISITALASWCVGDRWLSNLPVDEVVPMLFRMGRDHQKIARIWQADGHLPAPECGTSAGFAMDEWLPNLSKNSDTRVYIFNPRSWTPEFQEDAVRRLRQ